ncbi:MAG: glycosyltransferase family 4 protein [Actinomycetota bacterium]|nr:glycosyltransferase family 4 protein [Actinomycetota bacterium]
MLVDATAVPADRRGVGRYVDGLVAALGALGADLAVVCQLADVGHFGRLAADARIVAGPAAIARRPVRLAWEQTGMVRVAERVGADVIHAVHYTMPWRAALPVVVSVHDVTFFTEPDMHTAMKGPFFRWATRAALRQAARIIVPSRATRSELVRVLDADATRVDVAHHGVDTEVFTMPSRADRERVSSALGLENRRYVAFLGTLEPRKNVPGLIRGWVRCASGRSHAPALVLAGGSGWDADVDAALATVPDDLVVLRPGYLSLADLPAYLGGAQVFAYPSFGEGFGLPVLEAMACGAPVLTTRRLSLPEVGGDAVAYTEPNDEAIARELTALLDDPDRCLALGQAGHRRARQFTWEASAEAHLACYERAADPSGR